MIDIRQHDQYSLRNTIRAGCIHECWLFFNESHPAGSISELKTFDLAMAMPSPMASVRES
jgi:hypothetical protein